MNKLGFHVQGFTPAAVAAVQAQTGAALIKTMDLQPWAVEALQVWKANNPGGLVTYRYWIGSEAEGESAELERWQEFCDRLAVYVKDNAPVGLVDAVYIPFNEITPYASSPAFARHCELLPAMCEHLRHQWVDHGGMKIIAGNFSVTTPHPADAWDRLAPALQAAGADYLCLHRYSKTSLKKGHEHLYDFESVYAAHPGLPPLILGEFGVDGALWTDASMPREARFRGWQAFMDGASYAAQLRAAHQRLAGLSYVVGACVFNLDQYPPVDWETYLYAHAPEVLAAFGEAPAQRGAPPAVPPPSAGATGVGSGAGPIGSAVALPPPRLPSWLPERFAGQYREWRADPRNEWPADTDREEEEFWKLALATRSIDENEYRQRVRAMVAAGKAHTEYPDSAEVRRPVEDAPAPAFTPPLNAPAADRPALVPDPHPPDYSRLNLSLVLQSLAQRSGVPVPLWQAIIDVETSGVALTPEGFPICRFEVKQWASRVSPAVWGQVQGYFRGADTWQGNDDRFLLNGQWVAYQGDQALTPKVITFAANYDDPDLAYQCTSWGLFQLMGWHHGIAGYDSARAMALAFRSIDAQVEGYLAWASASGALAALQAGDLYSFANIHNGPARPDEVSARIGTLARQHGWSPESPPPAPGGWLS